MYGGCLCNLQKLTKGFTSFLQKQIQYPKPGQPANPANIKMYSMKKFTRCNNPRFAALCMYSTAIQFTAWLNSFL